MIAVMTITLPLPLPAADIAWRSSRALSSTGEFRSRHGIAAPHPVAGFQQPPTHIYSRSFRGSTRKETSKHSVPLKPFGDAAGDDKNGIKERSHADVHTHKHKSKGIASKRKELAGASQPASHHPDFTVNNTQPKHRIKPSNHRSVAEQAAQTYSHLEKRDSRGGHVHASADTIVSERGAADRRAAKSGLRRTNRNADTHIHGSRTSAKLAAHRQALEKHKQPRKHSLKSGIVGKKQQAVKKAPGYFKKRHNLSEDPSDAKGIPGLFDHRKPLSKPETAVMKDGSSSCESFREHDFLDSDRRRIRADLHRVPWLSRDDIQRMELLAEGEVVSKARMPGHGQVLQVALDPPAHRQVCCSAVVSVICVVPLQSRFR